MTDLNKKLNMAGYDEKVPQSIKDTNQQKKDNLMDEKNKLDESLKLMMTLK